MAGEAAGLYLDLMKKCLAFTLWEEPYIPVEAVMMNYRFHRRTLLRAFTRVLRSFHLRAVQDADYDQSRRAEGRMWPAYADTMIGLARLDNIQFCVESALRDNVAGDLLEAGVWRGGGTILMRAVLAAHQVRDRRVWVADSFQGLPKPDAMASPADAGDRHHRFEYLAVSREQVAANFRRYGLLDEQVAFIEGWFTDSLPTAPVERLAVLRVDADMYGSTMDVLTNLYPRVSSGGYVIIDDYGGLATCKTAVDDFRSQNGIATPIQEIDWSGVFWRKQ